MFPLTSPIRFQRAIDHRLCEGTAPRFREAYVRCSLLRPDPAQRHRLEEIRPNRLDRFAEAEREGWLAEVEGLQVSLAGADDKLTQITASLRRTAYAVQLGMPAFPDIAGRSQTTGPTRKKPRDHP